MVISIMKTHGFIILLILSLVIISSFSISIQAQENSQQTLCHEKETCKVKVNKRIGPIKNYVTYYGDNNIDDLKDFGLAIIDAGRQKPEDIAKLKTPVCYLSIGEVNTNDPLVRQNSLPEKCYLHNSDGSRSVSSSEGVFKSFHINARCREWKDIIKERAKKLMKLGCKGIFFDTVDTADFYIRGERGSNPSDVNHMASIIDSVRKDNPNSILIQNRGLNVIGQTHKNVDAIMWEAFATEGGNLRPERDDFMNAKLAELKTYNNLAVFSLDYGLENEQESVRQALEQGFLPYISPDLTLNRINKNKPIAIRCKHVLATQ